MQRIQKDTLKGNSVIDEILETAWNKEESRFLGDLYYGLLTAKNKENLKSRFLEEQNHKCCYCMREVSEHDTTIEHIIPQNVEVNEMKNYQIVPELTLGIVHKDTFNKYFHQVPPDNYPHDLAYNNLVASCDCKNHCNGGRGNKFISPIMYNQDWINSISYEPTGSVIVWDENISIEALNLDNHLLTMIRKTWKGIAKKIDSLEQISDENELQNIINIIFSDIDEYEEKYIETFKKIPKNIKVLYKYKWFFDYYKAQRI